MNHLQNALNAGFQTILPLIPVGARLFEGGTGRDGMPIPAADVDPNNMGKAPGLLMGASWCLRAGWTHYQITQQEVAIYDAAGASCGVLGGTHWVGIDVDVTDPELSALLLGAISRQFPNVQVRYGKWPKFLIAFQVSGEPIKPMRVSIVRGEESHLIEVIGKGRQFVLFGNHPATEQPYTWVRDDVPIWPRAADCYALDQRGVLDLIATLTDEAGLMGFTRGRSSTSTGDKTKTNGLG